VVANDATLGRPTIHQIAARASAIISLAMRALAKRNLSISAALRELQNRDPKGWGRYDPADLRKRYDEARKFWG
jgi:hypothetical protein